MDDQDVSPLAGVVALGVILTGLAAVAWLLVDASQTTSGGQGQVQMSDQQVVGTPSSHHRVGHGIQRCLDARLNRGGSGCVGVSAAPSTSAGATDRRAHRPARQGGGTAVRPSPTRAAVPPASVSRPPSTQPSTAEASSPPPAAPTRRPPSHNGPVPGGSTSPPHPGPRP